MLVACVITGIETILLLAKHVFSPPPLLPSCVSGPKSLFVYLICLLSLIQGHAPEAAEFTISAALPRLASLSLSVWAPEDVPGTEKVIS